MVSPILDSHEIVGTGPLSRSGEILTGLYKVGEPSNKCQWDNRSSIKLADEFFIFLGLKEHTFRQASVIKCNYFLNTPCKMGLQ